MKCQVFSAGMAIASIKTELVARVPAPSCGASGPRAAARRDVCAGCTAGQKPGRPRWPGLASLEVSPILGRIRRNDEGCTMKRVTSLLTALVIAVGCAACTAACGGAEEGIQHRLDDLCRLDAVALRGRGRHRQEVGRQVRHQHQRHADQRLRRIDQPVHRRQVRRRDPHQHGRADHPGRRRRRHHGADHRRLLQRQRRHRAQEGQDARRHQGPQDQHGRALGVALPAGARR